MTKTSSSTSESPATANQAPALRLALFNHKGGVSKTTTAFHLGWMLAKKGKRVVLVDADPQCNLSGLILGLRGQDAFDSFYKTDPERNFKAGLAPAFESRPKLIQGIECVEVSGNPNLFLLPGHIGLSEYEVTLGIAQELTGSIQTLQNLPGSLSYLLNRTAEKHKADFIIVDMNPSLSSINQNLLMTSDYFLVPTSPDYFSLMAIDSLAKVLPRWRNWAHQAAGMRILKDASYPFPDVVPKFLGTIAQRYRVRGGGKPAEGFRYWIDEINKEVSKKLLPMLDAAGMTIDPHRFEQVGIGPARCLAEIPDFNSLIAKAQGSRTPVFELTEKQIGLKGVVLERTIKSKENFRKTFSKLANNLITLVSR